MFLYTTISILETNTICMSGDFEGLQQVETSIDHQDAQYTGHQQAGSLDTPQPQSAQLSLREEDMFPDFRIVFDKLQEQARGSNRQGRNAT